MPTTYRILMRNRRLVNTDPQRRCYDGCHFSSELVWMPWEILESEVPEEKIEGKLKFWRDLNEYAVQARGDSAKSEFKTENCEVHHEPT